MASVHLIEQVFDRYQPEERLAVGGMSEVYRARDRVDGRQVALKVLLPQYANDLETRAAIEREAEIQQSLSHPNLVRLLELGSHGSTTYLVLEWVPGLTLAELIQKNQPNALGPTVASYIGVRILEALEAIHGARNSDGTRRGIVHRDIKPSNVIITPDGRVKVCDFGIARQGDHTPTRTGTIKGSLAYLAPEQATQSSVDARTDLYLTGLLLFEILTGVRYLEGEREVELVRAAENPPVRKPSDWGASRKWDRLLGRALARFPEERFKSAEGFRSALETLGASPEWSALGLDHHFDSAPLTIAPTETPRSRRRWFLAAAGVLATAGFIVGLRSEFEPSLPPAPSPIASRSSETDSRPAKPEASAPSVSDTPTDPPPSIALAHAGDAEAPPAPREQTTKPTRSKRGVASPRAEPALPKAEPTSTAEPSAEPTAPEPPAVAPEAVDPRKALDDAIGRLRARGLGLVDLDPALRRQVMECAQDCDALVAALDVVWIDRALIERKLARLQGAIPPDVDPEIKKISGLALQAFFDGRLNEANRYLNQLESEL